MIDNASVFVVVPARNEQPLIAKTIRGIPSFVDKVVVVDDASTDETKREALGTDDTRVVLLQHSNNQGVGAAIATGYRYAMEHGADIVAVMAGDNQMHPDDLVNLLAPVLHNEADYAKGDRIHHPLVRQCMPLQRLLAVRVLSTLTRLALDLESLSDSQCGYTAISGRALKRLNLDTLWPGFGYPNDLLGQLRTQNMRIVDVIVRPVYADETSALRTWHVAIILGLIARAAWRVRMSSRQTRRSVAS